MVVIFCDASFDDKTKKCGCGIVIKQMIKNGLKEIRIQIKDYAVDNNDAELKAILHGLRNIDIKKSKLINIATDSMVAVKILKGITTPNQKYQETVNLIQKELSGRKIRVYHVKGHANKNKYHHIQEICDKLSKKARC